MRFYLCKGLPQAILIGHPYLHQSGALVDLHCEAVIDTKLPSWPKNQLLPTAPNPASKVNTVLQSNHFSDDSNQGHPPESLDIMGALKSLPDAPHYFDQTEDLSH